MTLIIADENQKLARLALDPCVAILTDLVILAVLRTTLPRLV